MDRLRNRLLDNPQTVALLALLAVTAAWGATFVTVKGAVAHGSVLSFLTWRFFLGGGLLALLRPRCLLRLTRRQWARGVFLGLVLAGGYALQTFGLRYTSAAVSGFLTGLQVVFTPMLAWSVLRERPGARAWAATAFATMGLAVISLRGFSVGPGEILTVASAVFFAGQIVGVGRWSPTGDAYGLATVQLLTVAACCGLATLPKGPTLPARAGDWGTVVVTAVVATALAFVVQSWAQSHLSTARTAIVLTMEPVFAALVAWGAGEPVGWPVLAGGSLVLVAMLAIDLPRPGLVLRRRGLSPRGGPRSVPQHDLAELGART